MEVEDYIAECNEVKELFSIIQAAKDRLELIVTLAFDYEDE